MSGDVDTGIAMRAGRALREIHAGDPAGLDGGAPRFEQLRLAPYFTGLGVDHVVERLRATRTHLVHGDFSPKNILVGRDLTVLDWEVACAGDPVFDVAFALAHLVAKSVHLPAHREPLLTACRCLLAGYGPGLDEPWLAELLGALLLARVDGMSRLTYLSAGARSTVRDLARSLLAGGRPPW